MALTSIIRDTVPLSHVTLNHCAVTNSNSIAASDKLLKLITVTPTYTTLFGY